MSSEPSSSPRSQVHDGGVGSQAYTPKYTASADNLARLADGARVAAGGGASIVFEVPSVCWPTEATFTLLRDVGVHVGSTFTLTDRAGVETVYRVTHVDVPDDDDPDPRWTVSVVEWEA